MKHIEISEYIETNMDSLCEEVRQRLMPGTVDNPKYAQAKAMYEKYGLDNEKMNSYIRQDLGNLANALAGDDPEMLADYYAWMLEALKNHGVPEAIPRIGIETIGKVMEKHLDETDYELVRVYLEAAKIKLDDK